MVERIADKKSAIPQEESHKLKPKTANNVEEGVQLSVQVSCIVRYIICSICTGVESLKNSQAGNSLKVVLPLRLPFSFLSIFNSVKGIKKSDKNEKVDDALNIVSEVGTVADVIATSTDGFASVGLTTAKVATWTSPLFLVGLGLQAAGLVLTMKSLVETHRFSQTFKHSAGLKEKVENYSLSHFISSTRLITERNTTEKRFVSKHFGVGNKKLCARLEKIKGKAEIIFASKDQDKKLKYQKKLKNAVTLLDERMKVMKQSKAFTIAATVVGVIGVSVVLASPAAPVGFALLGIGAALELGHYFKMRSVTKKFEQAMKLEDTKK